MAGRIGLNMNVKKCKHMRMNNRVDAPLKINNIEVEDVEEFIYLGAKVSKDGGGTEDIKNRLGKARGAFRNLRRIWTNGAIGRKTKLTLFKTLVRSVLLYGSEAWKVTKREEQKLDAFQFKCIRRILKIPWTELVSNDRIMQQTGINRISVEIRRRRWNWIGHIMRKETGNHARVAMEWAPEGRRKVGRPKTTWRRTAIKRETRMAGEAGPM
ncbi:hypothetical protein BSL78_20130 [Apostichopus japonicus]|uniref:DUF6451 domain-containing protein n=1 Tax=Stichopus japonicus TaxID=307972 RepID=A0A2G8K4Y5_STIJA|nr:hypothetical protein BSL78_20130 [Apostichopus japonicus]